MSCVWLKDLRGSKLVLTECLATVEKRRLITGAPHGSTQELVAVLTAQRRELLDQ
jgi:hypothetical protein